MFCNVQNEMKLKRPKLFSFHKMGKKFFLHSMSKNNAHTKLKKRHYISYNGGNIHKPCVFDHYYVGTYLSR